MGRGAESEFQVNSLVFLESYLVVYMSTSKWEVTGGEVKKSVSDIIKCQDCCAIYPVTYKDSLVDCQFGSTKKSSKEKNPAILSLNEMSSPN